MPAAQQWISTTTGRVAPDPYSWMQAVHWVGGSGLYEPSRKHGPKWGLTTVAIAREISALAECRPGIAYLTRKLGVSERTVQYHLDMLREAGLLVYRSKGTRLTGRIRLASVYERVIPVRFDEALGIRTLLRDSTSPAYMRVPVGIAAQGRRLIGKLARLAARKVPRKRPSTRKTVGSDCTPMEGGTSTVSSAALTPLPSESKLASGEEVSPTPQQQEPKPQKGKARKLNRVGRRYQLARELIFLVPWLAAAAVPRIAWVIRHVADAGWTVDAVRAWLDLASTPSARRPSSLLAHRLKGAHLLWDTETKRATAVEAWRDSRTAERRRHDELLAEADGPTSRAVQRMVRDAFAAVELGLAAEFVSGTPCVEPEDGSVLRLEDLERELVIDMRAAAEADLTLITAALDGGMPEADARRLYTNELVDRALRPLSPTLRIHGAWQPAFARRGPGGITR
ncbi:helix-turn-helix domain-containing protein [Streptomyces sp.]|uniref:helix-turn-helix domain-containing protein n=1 Tax=Streptomyces sp. TaxID=1931 RepID=UPI002F955839